MSKADVGDFHTNFSSPTRWFSSRFVTRPTNRNRNGPKMDFFTFLENAPRVLGVPGGSQGVPWCIYHTKTKLWAPEKDHARFWEKIYKKITRTNYQNLRVQLSQMLHPK